MIDERLVGDVDLSALDFRRHRNDHGEVARLALKIVGHRHHGAVAVADDDDLRGAVENLRVALGDVEAAEGVCLRRGEQREDEDEAPFRHDHLLMQRQVRG